LWFSNLDDMVLRQRAGEIAAAAQHLGLHLLAAQAERLGAASHEGEFADRIGFSHGTVRSEVTQIYNKLGVDNREHAVIEARWRGLLAPHLSGDIAIS
jgi:DNA-binding CsgD family transcriptional regulator